MPPEGTRNQGPNPRTPRAGRNTATRVALAALLLSATVPAPAHDGAHTPPWQQASAWPDRVVATLETDPATSFAVSWRTEGGIERPVARIVEALPAPRFDRAADEVEARTERVRLDRTEFQGRVHRLDYPLDPARASFHSVNFTGLEPDTLYAYQVCGARAHCSEWFQIRTAPASGATLRFVYLGDALISNKGQQESGYEGASDWSLSHVAIDSPKTNGIVITHAARVCLGWIHGIEVVDHFVDNVGCDVLCENLFLTGRSGASSFQIDSLAGAQTIWDGRRAVEPNYDGTQARGPTDSIGAPSRERSPTTSARILPHHGRP